MFFLPDVHVGKRYKQSGIVDFKLKAREVSFQYNQQFEYMLGIIFLFLDIVNTMNQLGVLTN